MMLFRKKNRIFLFIGLFFFFFHFLQLSADLLTDDLPTFSGGCPPAPPPCAFPFPPGICTEGITVDLLNPIYCDGILSTDQGGVLVGPGIRIQAQKIQYMRRLDGDSPCVQVTCEGNVLVDYHERALIGESLSFDFINNKGVLIEGRTASPPWYVSGESVELCANGNVQVINGWISTSEGGERDVEVTARKITLTPEMLLTADKIRVRVKNTTLFYWPHLSLDLSEDFHSPFAVTYAWGGFKRSQVGLRYQFLKWKDWKGYARFDVFFSQGIGAGIETQYFPSHRPLEFFTRNYYATDLAIYDQHRHHRYRFQGTFADIIWNGSTSVNLVYDFVSDAQMASDYRTNDFADLTAGRTELDVRTQDDFWIARLFASKRVNTFQSVNQELPSLFWGWHPTELAETGIIAESIFNLGYFNYQFSDRIPNTNNFDAGRFEISPHIYRQFRWGPVVATPEASFIGIAYTNNPHHQFVGQAVGDFGIHSETSFSRRIGPFKHIIEPYAHYHILTNPRVNFDNSFIFTADDAYTSLQLLSFGVSQSFFNLVSPCCFRPLWINLWANAFFDAKNIKQTIPKGYLNVEWIPHPRLLSTTDIGWNFWEKQLDFINSRLDWTISEHLAASIEYRHRGRFDWRKADFYNFLLDKFRTRDELLNSPESDRRDTFLADVFYRLNPDWTARFQLRNGWNRKTIGSFFPVNPFSGDPPVPEQFPPYVEYLIDIGTVLFQHWRLHFIYESRSADKRFSFTLKLDPSPPPIARR